MKLNQRVGGDLKKDIQSANLWGGLQYVLPGNIWQFMVTLLITSFLKFKTMELATYAYIFTIFHEKFSKVI